MKRGTKGFFAGLLTGIIATSAVTFGGIKVKEYYAPKAEFLQAKAEVAEAYSVRVDDIQLYEYDMTSAIWRKIVDRNLESSQIYPNYVYTAVIDGKEKVLAVVVSSAAKPSYSWDFELCGRPIQVYEMECKFNERGCVYITTIDVAQKNLKLDSVIDGIRAQVYKTD